MINYERLAQAIVDWMRTYLGSTGLRGFVVGLSGGVDSAVTTALAVRAVGTENTHAVLMPCHSQPEDAYYAGLLARALHLRTQTIDLTTVCDALEAVLPDGPRLARANLRPRLRMTVLYYIAQTNHGLVAGTGNKPEMMVGYFTKYGDGGVDLEPLGALYKHEVRELARVLGVPQPIIDRAPTAGLWPGQTDEGELGITYDELDAILDALDRGASASVPEDVLHRVKRMIAGSAHKRALPPMFPVDRHNSRGW
ncbi:MAG: NAD+ synthase [Anaerolineae bacterium]|nr:NAD+ synthase [Anaerolineae bacterium]